MPGRPTSGTDRSTRKKRPPSSRNTVGHRPRVADDRGESSRSFDLAALRAVRTIGAGEKRAPTELEAIVDIAIMVEGQNGLTWPRWQRLARAVEDLRFAGLYRSDHFTNAGPPDKDSLELWTSLTWLAGNTRRMRFGPLVTPCSFRHPVMTARMAAAVDELSEGRLVLGLGAGWQEREHTNFGFDLLGLRDRMKRFNESLQIVTRLLSSDAPLTFTGEFYRLHEAVLLPRPRSGRPPILVGGNGPKRTLPLAARYAVEWNSTHQPPASFQRLSSRLDDLLRREERQPQDVRRSMMTGIVFGRSQTDLNAKLARRGRSAEELRARGILVGTGEAVLDQLRELDDVGLQGIMLQWLDLDDIEGLEGLARSVLGRV